MNEDFRELLAALLEAHAAITGVAFDEAWADRVTQQVEGLALPFLGRASLVRNKRASGRAKDMADLEALGEQA